jgi:hypothetical protein
MSKRSGFWVTVKAFREADPKQSGQMAYAAGAVDNIKGVLETDGFIAVEVESRFMLSKEIADEPPIAPAAESPAAEVPHPLDLPAGLDRRHRA